MSESDRGAALEAKFTKSRANRGTENAGLALLLADPRFQVVDLLAKRRIVESLGFASEGRFGVRTFDAVMLADPSIRLAAGNVEAHLGAIRLVEMKTTRDPIKDERLNGFFFGATENEYQLAELLGERYLFAFVVLNSENRFGAPFFVLLTLEQVEARTKVKRRQFQVNFRTDLTVSEPYVDVVVPSSNM